MNPTRATLAPAAFVAVAAHAAALVWLALLPPLPPTPVRLPPAKVTLVTRTPPPQRPPDPPPEPKPLRETPAARAPAPVRAAPQADPAPVPAPTTPPPPRRFAVSMGATVPGGGVAVPTTEGPTAARGRPDLPESAPVGDNTTAPVDVVEVERAPRPLRQPSGSELRRLYPEEARREAIEADVALRLLVGSDGRVAEVRVVRAAGNGFDEAAVAAAKGIEFQPAQRGGRAVAVWIPWTLKFRLDS